MVLGMNSGVMLFRKSEWSMKFLQAIADLGRIPEPKLGEVRIIIQKHHFTKALTAKMQTEIQSLGHSPYWLAEEHYIFSSFCY